MQADAIVQLMRASWLILMGMMLYSRLVFQLAGAARMRAFLTFWKGSTTKRWWGGLALAWGIVLLALSVPRRADLDGLDALLLGLVVAVLAGDGLLNLLPGSFGKFKERMQEAWVRRNRDPARAGDAALFGTVNALLAAAALAAAAIVTLYKPIELGTLAASLLLSAVLTGALIAAAVVEGRAGSRVG